MLPFKLVRALWSKELSDASHAPVLDIGGGWRDIYGLQFVKLCMSFLYVCYILNLKIRQCRKTRNNKNNYWQGKKYKFQLLGHDVFMYVENF